MHKLKVGIYSLSSCEGCIVQILNLEERLLEVLNHVDLVECRVLGLKHDDEVDVAFVEGFVSSDEEATKIKEIRGRSRILIALGDCAYSGMRFVAKDFGTSTIRADPINMYVNVDYHLRGCPIDSEEFLSLISDLIHGKKFKESSKTVCSECILLENKCLLDKGVLCLGPITRGGCNAICIANNKGCFGCRGLGDDVNISAFIESLKSKGISIPSYLLGLLKGPGYGSSQNS
ncbi:MAG: NADH:ubiquinone oxidoreductase [Candidatus Korarchaeota archaeon]|nr:NADH:ubiquinone oxidoreductase [Thermoproteota archaeon]